MGPTKIGACQCSKCGYPYVPKPEKKSVGNGVQETFFRCPACKHKTTAFFTDAAIRDKQQKINYLNSLYRGLRPPDITSGKDIDLRKQIDCLKAEIKNDMEALKVKMQG